MSKLIWNNKSGRLYLTTEAIELNALDNAVYQVNMDEHERLYKKWV